ncbi:Thioesterase-like superfamily protein [compost metagenome]
MRPIEGALPHAWDGGGDHSLSRLWVRETEPRGLDFCGLTALADVFFPRVWLRRATPVPVGTVSMTVYFHAGAAPLAGCGHGWLLGQARAQAFRNGFFDQTAQLWNEGGHLLATSHQIVYYKA